MGKSLNYQEIIKEQTVDLSLLIRKEQDSMNRDRLRFILSLKNGASKSQSKAAALIGLSERQGQNLWRKYRSGGLKELLQKIQGAAPCKLTSVQLQDLEEELRKDKIQFLHEGVDLIAEKYGHHYTTTGVYYLFKRLKIKKKTGRPVNIRQDKEGLKAFKKNLET